MASIERSIAANYTDADVHICLVIFAIAKGRVILGPILKPVHKNEPVEQGTCCISSPVMHT
jgi:hypothetical protein